MSHITFLSLYIINRVRLFRIVLGISSRKLSEMIGHSTGYVGMIESNATNGQYPPHELPAIAQALNCNVHDLLPADENDQKSTGELVEKKVFELDNTDNMQTVLLVMINREYFKTEKSVTEVTKYLNLTSAETITLMETSLEDLARNRQLKATDNGYVSS
jgi:transcriptional regulator with XRE-family HTH domain